MLYRPFLHYVSQKSTANRKADGRSFAAAAAGVSVSRNIVHITTEMKKRGLLTGAWFTMVSSSLNVNILSLKHLLPNLFGDVFKQILEVKRS